MTNGYRCVDWPVYGQIKPSQRRRLTTTVSEFFPIALYRESYLTAASSIDRSTSCLHSERGVNLIVVVIYRPGLRPADSAFFREFAAIVERVVSMSAPVVIVGNVNIHLDDPTSPSTNNFNDIIFGCDLRQLVTGPTHEAGHTLDVVITISCHIIKVDVDPPIYSDHSLISAVIPLQNATYVDPSVS